MAPLPPDNTPRIQVTYTSGGEPHTAEIRVANGTLKADALTRAQALADAMAVPMASGDNILGAYWIPSGTNIRQTLPITTASGGGAAGTITDESKTVFLSFTGRSDDGRDTRFTFFTVLFDGQDTYRKALTDVSTPVQDLFGEVTSNTLPAVTISGEEAIWNHYVNIGQNAHFQRKSR